MGVIRLDCIATKEKRFKHVIDQQRLHNFIANLTRSRMSDNERLALVTIFAPYHYFTCRQCHEILSSFGMGNEKVQAALLLNFRSDMLCTESALVPNVFSMYGIFAAALRCAALAVLCCAVLCCAFCALLCCAVLSCAVPCCAVPCCAVLILWCASLMDTSHSVLPNEAKMLADLLNSVHRPLCGSDCQSDCLASAGWWTWICCQICWPTCSRAMHVPSTGALGS